MLYKFSVLKIIHHKLKEGENQKKDFLFYQYLVLELVVNLGKGF